MPVLVNTGTVYTCAPAGGQSTLHVVEEGVLAWRDGTLEFVGVAGDLPADFASEERIDARGHLVFPGLVDCHTHLAFAGSRADEFERRIAGEGYLEIAASGGGIQKTVRSTREASRDELLDTARARLRKMVELGVTTVECKSGYGLELATELRQLEVYEELAREGTHYRPGSARIVPTFLGAHVVAPEYRENRLAYVDLVIEKMLPTIAERGLARFCDVFVEEGAFTPEEARRILEQAKELGMRPKLHVDQLSDTGGGELAASVGATSADHLEYVSAAGIEAMATSGVVAVSLPLATLFLGQTPMPARACIEAGVPVAVATDWNPGSAPSHHLPLAMLLASVMQKMTAAEVIKGATCYAARALDLEDTLGSLEVGKQADFILVDAPSERDWIYHFEANAVVSTWRAGHRVAGQGPLD